MVITEQLHSMSNFSLLNELFEFNLNYKATKNGFNFMAQRIFLIYLVVENNLNSVLKLICGVPNFSFSSKHVFISNFRH